MILILEPLEESERLCFPPSISPDSTIPKNTTGQRCLLHRCWAMVLWLVSVFKCCGAFTLSIGLAAIFLIDNSEMDDYPLFVIYFLDEGKGDEWVKDNSKQT